MLVEQLGFDPFLRGRSTIELVAWDAPGAGAPMLANRTPQASIDAGMPRPSECDIVIAIFWSRLGTPLPSPEYSRAERLTLRLRVGLGAGGRTRGVSRQGSTARPGVPSSAPSRTGPGRTRRRGAVGTVPRHRGAVRRLPRRGTNSIRAGHTTYERPDDFRQRLEQDLRALLKDLLEAAPTAPDAVVASRDTVARIAVSRAALVHARRHADLLGRGRQRRISSRHASMSTRSSL